MSISYPLVKLPRTQARHRPHSSTKSTLNTESPTPSPAKREAYAAGDRMTVRRLSQEHDMGISYNPPSTSTSPSSPILNDHHIINFSDYDAERAEGQRPPLRHIPPAPESDSPQPSPSEHSDDGLIIFYSGRRRWDLGPSELGPDFLDHWYNLNFDEWNPCIGVWLVYCVIAIVVVGGGMLIWGMVIR